MSDGIEDSISHSVTPGWGSDDCGVFDPNEKSELDNEQMDAAKRALQRVLHWVYRNGRNEKNGIAIRAIVATWIFTPEVGRYKLTELALACGKDKQSFGRWVDDWKKHFPNIKNNHME